MGKAIPGNGFHRIDMRTKRAIDVGFNHFSFPSSIQTVKSYKLQNKFLIGI